MEAFKAGIQNFDLFIYPKTNATELAVQYDRVLYTLINLHAPLVTKKISIKPPNPWMTHSILASKRYRRYLGRVWRSNPTAKSAHYSKIIAEDSGYYGSLLKEFNKILHRCPKIHLPDHSSITTLANTFSSFFNKIALPSPLTHTHLC